MKVKKSEAIEFFRSINFPKVVDWDDETLVGRLKQVPEKVKKEDVPEAQLGFYNSLGEANNGEIELVADVEQKPKKKAAKKEPKEKAAKKEKAPKKEKSKREVDAFGATVGTIRAKVNGALSKDWKSKEEIAKEAGVKVKQANIRLRRAVKQKVVEVRRRVEYRLVEGKK